MGPKPRLQAENVYRRISGIRHPDCNVIPELQKWISEGRPLRKWELQLLIKELRKFRRYTHALQVSEWMGDERGYSLGLADHAIRLDLIGAVNGVASAENYFQRLPQTAKVEPTYGALLNSYVRENLTEKAESHMKRMQELGFASTVLPYNEMLTLYLKTGELEKVPLMINEIRENKIPQDKFTYNIRMNVCATIGDIDGVEKVWNEMEYQNEFKIDWTSYANLANIYIKAGLLSKAQSTLKCMEKKLDIKNRDAFNYLITLFASAGDLDGVSRTWQSLKSTFANLTNSSFICMISSLLKLDDLERAERVFEEWVSANLAYDWKVPNVIFDAYVKRGLIDRAESLFHRCSEKQQRPVSSRTWEIISEGYLKNGNIDKAIHAMNEAVSGMEQSGWKPKPANLHVLLKNIQDRGDLLHAEKISKILQDIDCTDSKSQNSL